MPLRHPADRRSIACVTLQAGLLALAWASGGHAALLAVSAVLAVSVTTIAHNHAHVPLWHGRVANRITDVALSAMMGVPMLVFPASHVAMHHRHLRSGRDRTLPARFGPDNHLAGFLAHPFRVLPVVIPDIVRHVRRRLHRCPADRPWIAAQCVAVIGPGAVLGAIDPTLWTSTVLIPQLAGIHMLLGANYLQHAGARPLDPAAHSRSFVGAVNRLWFNIGLHHAHHEHPQAHWSALPALHRAAAPGMDPAMIERSLVTYMLRTLALRPLRHRGAAR